MKEEKLIENKYIKVGIVTTLLILSAVIGWTWSARGFKAEVDSKFKTTENQYEHCTKWYKELEEEQAKISASNSSQDLIIVEIKTKLTNIELLLVELKSDLKSK